MDLDLILKSLGEFELSPYEAKSYFSLLGKSSLSAVEIAKISGVPRGRIYEILDTLTQKGLCVSVSGNEKKFKAADPAVLNEKIKLKINRAEEEISQKKSELDSLKKNAQETINKLIPIYQKNRENDSPVDFIEIYHDRIQLEKRVSELVKTAKEEILTMQKPTINWYPPPHKEYDYWLEEFSKRSVDLKKRGVKLRGLYEFSKEDEYRIKWQFKQLVHQVKFGKEARIAEEVPLTADTIDTKIVLIMMERIISEKPTYTFQIIYHEGMARTIKLAFDMLWESAEEYHVFMARNKDRMDQI